MTQPLIDDDTLQTYLDGELEAGEAARVAAAVASDPLLALRLETLRLLGTGVRAAEAASDARVSASSSDALFAAIEQRLRSSAAPQAKPALRAVPGGRGVKILAATTTVLAMAAGIALMVRTTPEITLPTAGVRTQIAVPNVPPAPQLPRGSQILDVEFGKHTGTHFTLEGEAGEPIAVVWIQEDVNEARQ